MKILTYEEVDHDQVLELHLSAFGWPLTEDRVRAKIEHDDRAPKDFALYAVKGLKVLGQVFALRIPTVTRAGVEVVMGVAEVATAPDEVRKGIATTLMRRVEEMAVEEGLRFCWLLTGAHLVAHEMYLKLGYHNMSSFPRGFRRVPMKIAAPTELELRKYRKSDRDTIADAYDNHMAGSIGFTKRQRNHLEMLVDTKFLQKDDIKVATRGGSIVGYTVRHARLGMFSITEVISRNASNFRSIVRAIEAENKGALAIASSLINMEQRERFEGLGYRISPTHWYRLMAKPLDNKISRQEMKRLYGVDDGNFTFMSLDGF